MFSGVLRAMQRCWAWSLQWWDETSAPLSIPRSARLRWRKSALSPLDTSAPQRPLSCARLSSGGCVTISQQAVQDWVFSQWFFQTKLNLVWNFQDIDNDHQNFPNQSEFGLESASCKINFFLSKPNWNWFGKLYAIFGCNFSKPNWIWFGKGHWMKCS